MPSCKRNIRTISLGIITLCLVAWNILRHAGGDLTSYYSYYEDVQINLPNVRVAFESSFLNNSTFMNSTFMNSVIMNSPFMNSVMSTLSTLTFKEMEEAEKDTAEDDELLDTSLTARPAENKKSLALVYPPGMLGGYRNQVMRFFAFVLYAKRGKISQLLLPSLLWTTKLYITDENGITKEKLKPLPMALLFDIQHWNEVAERIRKESKMDFPFMVNDIGDGDCWNASSSAKFVGRGANGKKTHDTDEITWRVMTKKQEEMLWQQSLPSPFFLIPIANDSQYFARGELAINPRKVDYLSQVRDCRHPMAYGGGKGPGRLWTDYAQYHNRQRSRTNVRDVPHFQPDDLEGALYEALQPKFIWRKMASQCVQHSIARAHGNPKMAMKTNNTSGSGKKAFKYIALHPRVEIEMMVHKCGKDMQRNLTRVFEQVEELILQNQHLEEFQNIQGVFIANSRAGLEHNKERYNKLIDIATENIAAYDRIVMDDSRLGEGLLNRTLPVFDCGERWLHHQLYSKYPDSMDYGSVLPSIMNFHILAEASAFIGFRKSSYSNGVWTTRFYQGKGSTNFEYTKENGIQPIENGGLPAPHSDC